MIVAICTRGKTYVVYHHSASRPACYHMSALKKKGVFKNSRVTEGPIFFRLKGKRGRGMGWGPKLIDKVRPPLPSPNTVKSYILHFTIY